MNIKQELLRLAYALPGNGPYTLTLPPDAFEALVEQCRDEDSYSPVRWSDHVAARHVQEFQVGPITVKRT